MMEPEGIILSDSMGRRGSKEELVLDPSIGYRKTSKIYIFSLIFLVLAVLGLTGTLIYFVLENNDCRSSSEPSKAEVCTKTQCIKSAAALLDAMDQNINPCDNFYDYACGGWDKKHVIPEDRSSYSSFNVLDEEVTVLCKDLLEEEAVAGEPKAITNVRTYYKSCLDMDSINNLGATPLTDMLTMIGGWPVLDTAEGGGWNQTAYDFADLLANLNKMFGLSPIISSGVGVDDKQSSVYVLTIDQPSFILGRDYYLNANYSAQQEAYLNYMVQSAVALNSSLTQENVTAQMNQVLQFETMLAKLSVPNSERRDAEALYHIYTLDELEGNYTQMDWVMYYDKLLPGKVKPIPPTERVLNHSPDYMTNMLEYLNEVDTRVVANYLVWRVVSAKMGDMGQTFLDIRQTFTNVIDGTSASSARWKLCIGEVQSSVFEFATGRLFVDEHFPQTARDKTVQMVTNLKNAFKDMLDTNTWLTVEDKLVAAAKADAMSVNVGYPDWIKNDTKLDEFYQNVPDFMVDEYYNNDDVYIKWGVQRRLASLRNPVDKETWGMGPAVVNAYYSPDENKIVFPAGILRPPFYHQDLPWYHNYGGVGVVIGHEITHGFDDEGRQFDKDGNLKAWWSPESIKNFKERAQCIIDQYSAFVMPENNQHLNGIQTQGENIADNGGLKESFKAYNDNTGDQQGLPGVDLSNDQLYFLSYGQVWCSLFRPEGVASLILTNPHSPGRYRVIGPTQNSVDFSKAFNCPAGSYMNPDKKCDVW